MPVRVRPALLVLAVGLTVGLVASLASARPTVPSTSARAARSVDSTRDAGAQPLEDRAAAVLHAWDRRRAAAWAAGDAGRLAALYTPGSPAGAADVALLERYAARGLVVDGMRMQLLRARVLVLRPRVIEVEVTDRLAAAVAVSSADPAVRRPLPADSATTRVLVLRRVDGRWLVGRVSAVRGR